MASYSRQDEEPEGLYVSVGEISRFVLRPSEAAGLRFGLDGISESQATSLACKAEDVLITRSGTPGIAWAFESASGLDPDVPVVPSGFMIRIRCDPDHLSPTFVAAILNHPAWRVWTSALAAGKRQRNLSQDHLRELSIPRLARRDQDGIAATYCEALASIEQMLSDDHGIEPGCNRALHDIIGLQIPTNPSRAITVERVEAGDVIANRFLRLDYRHLRSDYRMYERSLTAEPHVPLMALVEDCIKGSQPEILTVDDQEPFRVVATVSVQNGRVDASLTKPTTEQYVANAGARKICKGDLLITVDGEGSIGKAAIFGDEYDAVCDSHVAILRLKEPAIAPSVACLLNSGFGRAHVQRYASGSTGQIQLSTDDLCRLAVPKALLNNLQSVAAEYGRVVGGHRTGSRRIKQRICSAESLITDALIGKGCFIAEDVSTVVEYSEPSKLLDILGLLVPRMF